MSQIGRIAKAALQADLFAHVPQAPADPIIWTKIAFSQDTHPQKINLGVGAYRDDHGNPYVFNVVRKIEQEIANKSINHVSEETLRSISKLMAFRNS
jgi:aspartate/tyrosine/aromatic aminotransferase